MATVREGWKLPEKPIHQDGTCDGEVEPHAIHDTGWWLYWDCENGCGQITPDQIEWPFGEGEKVSALDLDALGFEIV